MKKSSRNNASCLVLACGFALAGCSTSPQGRMQIVAPQEVSKAYSEADLRIQLATTTSVATPCAGVECTRNQQFDQQVQSAGNLLSLAAYEIYPDLVKRVSAFQFEVANKAEPGTTSSAAGKIVVYRAVQDMEFDEAGVAFLIAREMGHVIGKHHEENSGARILLSIAASVLFPALNLFNGTAQVAQQATQVTSASVLGSTVATTATSYVGSKAILASLKPDQLSEADTIGLLLMDRAGWHLHDLAGMTGSEEKIKAGGSWAEDLQVSFTRLKTLDIEAQSTDLARQPMELGVQRECRADDEESLDTLQEPAPEIPVMVAELPPPPSPLAQEVRLPEVAPPVPAADVMQPERASDPAPIMAQVEPAVALAPAATLHKAPLLRRNAGPVKLRLAKAPARKKVAKGAGAKKKLAGKPAKNGQVASAKTGRRTAAVKRTSSTKSRPGA